ncbi:helix-turn-helix domain-containing protein [Streptomyces hoynatensis]|uniref:helix-turn-helix domain-containing protein n=1 Tax=Streptomyces hoynatensis TaxID=1141874 RepID=UPI001880D793
MESHASHRARVLPLRPVAAAPAEAAKEPLWRHVVGGVLRRERLAQERTLQDVADEARISMPYLSELERGRKEASSEVLAAAAKALGLRLADLLGLVQGELAGLSRPAGGAAAARRGRARPEREGVAGKEAAAGEQAAARRAAGEGGAAEPATASLVSTGPAPQAARPAGPAAQPAPAAATETPLVSSVSSAPSVVSSAASPAPSCAPSSVPSAVSRLRARRRGPAAPQQGEVRLAA